MHDEIPLTGGRITQGVVKKGDYVLRPCCANSDFVHAVLKWLESKKISAAPKFIGLTDDGREITTFLEGTSPEDLDYFSDQQLFRAGEIIKTLHNALSDFDGCKVGQTVCHNDLSPCNFMFMDGMPYAVFDWDTAEIGDPLNDVAYAAWMWGNIGDEDSSPADVGKRIDALLNGYGLGKEGQNKLIEKIHEQIQQVAKSTLEAKRTDAYEWATHCGLWLTKHQNQIGVNWSHFATV